jgi:hypothetical protein
MNITDTIPPDSGGWKHIGGAWIETTDDLYLDNIDFQTRKEGSFKVTVDGFPRQGNRYLRGKILSAFPDAAMPFPLCHKQVAFEEAIKNNHFVFSTFRDPLKSVSSYISHFIKQQNNNILNILNKLIYTEDDYIYIEKCFLFHIRMTDFVCNNIDNIFVIPFETITNDKDNSLTTSIANLLPTTQYVEAHEEEPHSSKDMKMQDYLMTDKFYDIMQLANQSYDRVLALSSTKKDRFVL